MISHKATIRIMLCSLLGIDVGRYRDRLDMPVASLSVVEMTERGPLLKSLGDRSHLREPCSPATWQVRAGILTLNQLLAPNQIMERLGPQRILLKKLEKQSRTGIIG